MNDISITNKEILQLHILIVDDTIENIILLQAFLEKAGYNNIDSISDSRKFHDKIASAKFDIILLDIRMPYKSGLDILQETKNNRERDFVPVIVLTAQIDTETRIKALELGANDFLTKPFNATEVIHRVKNTLFTKLLYNKNKNQNKVLEEQVKARTQELHESRLDFIIRLGKASEYKDNETGSHIIRMSKYSHMISKKLGMSEKETELILHASPMHDLGKIGIPDKILLKPGKLDPDEWEIMKTHAQIGANILADHPSEIVQKAQVIALTHHEKWDGSGYPNKLIGETIPIEGRITAICDVFDALTSKRPYKKSWPVDKAMDFIMEQSGKHFDPVIVEVFQRALPEMLLIKNKFQDEPWGV